MESYRSFNGHVAKYVHDDGSETAIKTTPPGEPGCGGYGKVTNKFNVFLSSSVGCPVKCTFCYLTTKKCPYSPVPVSQTVSNVIEAIKAEIKVRPFLSIMYAKLSWMGMGEAYINTETTYRATSKIIDRLIMEEIVPGIDGVDIATTLPRISSTASGFILPMNSLLNSVKLNPSREYNKDRHPLRIFYSLHSAINSTRKSLIPLSAPLDVAIEYLSTLNTKPVELILHHIFFEGINDSAIEVAALKRLITQDDFKNTELRLLRFNKCPGTDYNESSKFDDIVKELLEIHPNIKVQTSPGEEIFSSCGQFMLSKIIGIN